ncbi:hypothetical protein OH76DRAFT_1184805 [Lentinus brumalis]|uniref:Uncharacterized protein n=1 Tax=Lentinus brumalis TaxID=2498619 RepID=A0A371CTM0_9APHY|nr:hypothetical protein OH76DRAFT_1184805 [Polyporus brumalis]
MSRVLDTAVKVIVVVCFQTTDRQAPTTRQGHIGGSRSACLEFDKDFGFRSIQTYRDHCKRRRTNSAQRNVLEGTQPARSESARVHDPSATCHLRNKDATRRRRL